MLQCGIFHKLQCEWVCAPISCSETHLPSWSSPCAPWKYLLSCQEHLPSPFPHLIVPSAVSHPSACPAFLHLLKHASTAAPRAQLLGPIQPGEGLWQSWLSLAQGSHNSFSQMPLYSPPQLPKPCPVSPKIGLSAPKVSDLMIFRLERCPPDTGGKKLSLMENFSGRISFQCWART